jgi:hypothetical protein
MNQPTTPGRSTSKLAKRWLPAAASVAALTLSAAFACAADQPASAAGPAQTKTMNLTIKVGARTFAATLEDNATVTAFKARLPLTVQMSELNGNEKLYRFPADLPTNPSNPGSIQNGDLMIYGRNTLVLFYKTFPTSYSYTRLGRVTDPAGLAAALGPGDIRVTYELPDQAKGNSR